MRNNRVETSWMGSRHAARRHLARWRARAWQSVPSTIPGQARGNVYGAVWSSVVDRFGILTQMEHLNDVRFVFSFFLSLRARLVIEFTFAWQKKVSIKREVFESIRNHWNLRAKHRRVRLNWSWKWNQQFDSLKISDAMENFISEV